MNHLDLLGKRAYDKVSGIEGIVTSVSFDLYGIVQVLLHPGKNKDGELASQIWIEIQRVEIIEPLPLIQQPIF